MLIYSPGSSWTLMPNIFSKTVPNLSSWFTFENHLLNMYCLHVSKDGYKTATISHALLESYNSPMEKTKSLPFESGWPCDSFITTRVDRRDVRGFWIRVRKDNAVFALLAGSLAFRAVSCHCREFDYPEALMLFRNPGYREKWHIGVPAVSPSWLLATWGRVL